MKTHLCSFMICLAIGTSGGLLSQVPAKASSTSGLEAGHFKTKRFHGYRIEAKNYIRFNTSYNSRQHLIVSKYRPTSKSKVIFRYGTKIIPTHHMWAWYHGKSDNSITIYHYTRGHWRMLS